MQSTSPLKSDEIESSSGGGSNDKQQLLTKLLKNADETYNKKRKQIEEQINSESKQLVESLEKKQKMMLADAKAEHKKMKSTIFESADTSESSAGTCAICNTSLDKIPAAKCIENNCGSIFCKSCLQDKIGDHLQCHCCNDTVNVLCQTCSEERNKKSWYQFNSCREYCGFICSEHTSIEDCCVCGRCTLCSPATGSKCTLLDCDRCGRPLCSRCEYKEGCMCA